MAKTPGKKKKGGAGRRLPARPSSRMGKRDEATVMSFRGKKEDDVRNFPFESLHP